MSQEINCPGEMDLTGNKSLVESGEGYGKDKQIALDAARSQAKSKLDARVANYTCAKGCEKSVEPDPDYDSKTPKYDPWPDSNSPSFKCTVEETRPVKIRCTSKTSMTPANFLGDEVLGGFIREIARNEIDGRLGKVVAFVSPKEKKIIVQKDHLTSVMRALKGMKGETGWKLPHLSGELMLEEREGEPKPDQPKDQKRGPEIGAIRVRMGRKCGPEHPEREGICRQVLRDPNLWAHVTLFPRSICIPAKPEDLCIETYSFIGQWGIYSDPDCLNPVAEFDINAWTC